MVFLLSRYVVSVAAMAASCDEEGTTWFFSSCGGILDTSLDEVYFALQLLESNRQLSLANRMEDWLLHSSTEKP